MKESDDCEHYNWTRINPDDAGVKELVNAFFSWENFPSGFKPYSQGKIFK